MFHVLAFLLLVPAQGTNEAEQLFRKMEAKLLKARTLECVFEVKFEIAFALAEGNKFRADFTIKNGETSSKHTLISDGVKVVINDKGSQGEVPEPVQKMFTALIERAHGIFARGGAQALIIPSEWLGEMKKDTKVEDLFQVADFKLGKKEKVGGRDAQVIEYKLTIKPDKEAITIRTWVDVKTNLPLKRAMGDEKEKGGITETYSKLTLDEKIDPKKFELPK